MVIPIAGVGLGPTVGHCRLRSTPALCGRSVITLNLFDGVKSGYTPRLSYDAIVGTLYQFGHPDRPPQKKEHCCHAKQPLTRAIIVWKEI
eukprot:5404332-Amphidinium_carterae.2